MTTAQTIHDVLSWPSTTTVQTVKAVNAAIDASYRYGFVLAEKASTAFTLASGTFAYSLAALTDLTPELGAGELWVNHDSTAQPAFLLRQWRQEYDRSAGAWTIYVPSGIASAYTGKTVDILYNYRHPRITAIGDTIYLPEEYARLYVQSWYAEVRAAESQVDDRSQAARLVREYREDAVRAILAHPKHIYQTPRTIPDAMG